MSLADGKYQGTIVGSVVGYTKDGSLGWEVTIDFDEYLDGGEWVAMETVRFSDVLWMDSKEGKINVKKVESIKSATGWDNGDPMWLQQNAIGMKVQATLKNEEYKGVSRCKIQWLNPYGSESFSLIPPTPDQTRDFSLRFRSAFGGTPVGGGSPAPVARRKQASGAANQAPTAAPAPPAKAASASQPARRTPGAQKQRPKKDEVTAYNEFIKMFKPGVQPDVIEAEWFRVFDEVYPGAEPGTVDYNKLIDDAPVLIKKELLDGVIGSPVFKPDDIPF